jgi:hypothetical protein
MKGDLTFSGLLMTQLSLSWIILTANLQIHDASKTLEFLGFPFKFYF